jgi:cell wall-associated NlpC family hydrolase
MISQARQFVGHSVTVLLLLVMSGCATSPPEPADVGDRAASAALQQVGRPYRYGGSSPSGFDCSGLVQFAYATVGVKVPRTTSGQWAELAPVSKREMRAGDLLFFNIDGKMSHVGMYVGDGKFVHAPSSGKRVSIETLDSRFYSRAFIRAGRPE